MQHEIFFPQLASPSAVFFPGVPTPNAAAMQIQALRHWLRNAEPSRSQNNCIGALLKIIELAKQIFDVTYGA